MPTPRRLKKEGIVRESITPVPQIVDPPRNAVFADDADAAGCLFVCLIPRLSIFMVADSYFFLLQPVKELKFISRLFASLMYAFIHGTSVKIGISDMEEKGSCVWSSLLEKKSFTFINEIDRKSSDPTNPKRTSKFIKISTGIFLKYRMLRSSFYSPEH